MGSGSVKTLTATPLLSFFQSQAQRKLPDVTSLYFTRLFIILLLIILVLCVAIASVIVSPFFASHGFYVSREVAAFLRADGLPVLLGRRDNRTIIFSCRSADSVTASVCIYSSSFFLSFSSAILSALSQSDHTKLRLLLCRHLRRF